MKRKESIEKEKRRKACNKIGHTGKDEWNEVRFKAPPGSMRGDMSHRGYTGGGPLGGHEVETETMPTDLLCNIS